MTRQRALFRAKARLLTDPRQSTDLFPRRSQAVRYGMDRRGIPFTRWFHGSAAGLPVLFAAGLAVCLAASHPVSTLVSDSYMTLYVGRWIAQHGIPHREALTVAAEGRGWIDQQWLAEWINYQMWRGFGSAGVALLNAGMIGAAYAGLAWIMRRLGASTVLTLCAGALALIVGLPSEFIRSQDLALPLFVALLALCLTDSEHETPRRRLLGLIPLLVLWANLHGSVLLGAGLAVIYLSGRAALLWARGQRQAGGFVLALAGLLALTPLATPYGVDIIRYYGRLLGNSTIAAAQSEWHPPVPGQLSFVVFLVSLLLILLSSGPLLIKGRRPPAMLAILALIIGVAAGMAARNTLWFGMVAGLYAAAALSAWLPERTLSHGFTRTVGALAILLLALGVARLINERPAQYESSTPLVALNAAAAYASAHPCALILGDNGSSSALLWHYPKLAGRVGFDARLEQYPPAQLERWFIFERGNLENWRQSTRGYRILIASGASAPLMQRLAGMPPADTLAKGPHGIAALNSQAGARRCV